MRPAAPGAVVTVVTVGLLALAAGCTGSSGDRAAPATPPRSTTAAPATPSPSAVALGGPSHRGRRPPQRPMDGLERPVARRLDAQLAPLRLHLDYVDCPVWGGGVPVRMTCRGYVDGLVAGVGVRLRTAAGSGSVAFDARLRDGLVATEKLRTTLREQGWRRVDCGGVAAYPARAGLRIVCRGERAGQARYLVAEVRDRSGRVGIRDDGPAPGHG